jgi:hypothetical protein
MLKMSHFPNNIEIATLCDRILCVRTRHLWQSSELNNQITEFFGKLGTKLLGKGILEE